MGQIITIALVVVVLGGLVIGSIVEIHAKSAPYRAMADRLGTRRSYASRVVDASNQSGARLAAVINTAPNIPNQPFPNTARGEIQQGLDVAGVHHLARTPPGQGADPALDQ